MGRFKIHTFWPLVSRTCDADKPLFKTLSANSVNQHLRAAMSKLRYGQGRCYSSQEPRMGGAEEIKDSPPTSRPSLNPVSGPRADTRATSTIRPPRLSTYKNSPSTPITPIETIPTPNSPRPTKNYAERRQKYCWPSAAKIIRDYPNRPIARSPKHRINTSY